MNWSGRKTLITGAGGFIGSSLTEELVRRGAEVTAFVRYNSRNDWGCVEELPRDIKSQVRIVAGDLKDADALRRLCTGIQTLFHLGALIAIPYSYQHPRDHVETNVLGTLNVLVAARESGVERIVHTSTSEVYGTARYTPIDEGHPLQGQSPYSASKIGADKLAESFFLSYALPVTTVRPFNTYGPRQSARAVIPTIISQALTGPRIRIGSLEPKRDFTFVEDTVRGFLAAAGTEEALGQVINIGSQKEISVGELIDSILSLLGKDCEVVQERQRIRPEESEVMRLLADRTKAKTLLNWEPRVSLSEGLQKTIDYIQKHPSRYKADLYNI